MNIIIILLLVLIVINNNLKIRLGLLSVLFIIAYLENLRKNYKVERFSQSNIDRLNSLALKNEGIKNAINECMTEKEYKLLINKVKCLSNSSSFKSAINNTLNNVVPSKFSIAQYLLKSLTF